MKQSDKIIIVIGRQFGSGGRKIGMAVARMLGIPYYDKMIISKVATRFGYDPEILLGADEKKPSLFGSILPGKYGIMDTYASSPISKESLYDLQTQVIRQICLEGSCVIVGRTADYIMRDHPGLLSVFIHAPEEWRAANLVNRNEAKSEQEAHSLIRKADSGRQGYYNYFTGRNWGWPTTTISLSTDPSSTPMISPESLPTWRNGMPETMILHFSRTIFRFPM